MVGNSLFLEDARRLFANRSRLTSGIIDDEEKMTLDESR